MPNHIDDDKDYIEPKCEGCGTTEDIEFAVDPYAYELYYDDTKVWLCSECSYQRAMDI